MSIRYLQDENMIMYENYTGHPVMFYKKLFLCGRSFQHQYTRIFLDKLSFKHHLNAQLFNDPCQNYNGLKEHRNSFFFKE